MSLGVCYYPEHWPEAWWAEDARRMRELGIEYVRIGEFAWTRLEPRRGEFRWDWLDRAIDALSAAGLKIVLGTPTATPPKWLMDEHPEIAPTDERGRPRGFGSRRHYSFSSPVYLEEAARIVEALARRYGRRAALAGWQTDNEYGCHDTIVSWGADDLTAFREWLRRRYQSPDELNAAWGGVFWSMEVSSFDEVAAPNLTVTEPNPAARLDYRRFASSQTRAFDRVQVEIIREHSPGRWITHNFMGFFDGFDHWDVGEDLDFASWDSYPIGFVERFPFSEAERDLWQDTSHPDIAPFHHDLYRGVGRGRFWVMEQQPGPVNWAPYNPIPAPGMVKLWAIEAHAHGADVCSYFRWRQAPFAQEQMHAGLNLPHGHELSPGGREAEAAARDLAALGDLPPTARAPVALVFDYEAIWAIQIQPQGASFNPLELIFRWYEAVRRLGLDVDFVRPGASLEGYWLVLAPCLPIVSDAAERAFAEASGLVVFGPRAGSKTRDFRIPDNLPPGPLASLLPMRVIEVSSTRPGAGVGVEGAISGGAERWRERIETTCEVLARFDDDGGPAIVAHEGCVYVGFWPDAAALESLMRFAAERSGLATIALPEAIRARRRGDLTFVFNYGREAWRAPAHLGGREAPPRGYFVTRDDTLGRTASPTPA
jgi:beta-galactosidase